MRHVNDAGLELIKAAEGFRAAPYLDAVGKATIGWGSTYAGAKKITLAHPRITEEQGEALLREGTEWAEGAVTTFVDVDLTDNQFSALVSFVYNVGRGAFCRSTLLGLLNEGDIEGASNEFPRWKYAKGRALAGLVTRRENERALFLA